MSKDIECYQIQAPNFTAGIEVERGLADPVVSPNCMLAPIIKFMRGWSIREVERYCYSKGWGLAVVP